MKHPDIPLYLAVHEAAHAVVALDQGVDFHYVVVRSRDECDAAPYIDRRGRENSCQGIMEGGYWNPYPPEMTSTMPPGLIRERLELMRHHVIVRLAGFVGEARFLHRSYTDACLTGGREDWAHSNNAIAEFASGPQARELMDELFEETRATLLRPEVWTAVLRVATNLQRRRKLIMEEVLEIAGCTWNDGQRAVWKAGARERASTR